MLRETRSYFLAYTVFLAFNTPEFCNAYFRSAEAASNEGMFTLGGFMSFWGWVFLLSTVCVLFVRRDEHTAIAEGIGAQLASAYKEMLLVLQASSVPDLPQLLPPSPPDLPLDQPLHAPAAAPPALSRATYSLKPR